MFTKYVSITAAVTLLSVLTGVPGAVQAQGTFEAQVDDSQIARAVAAELSEDKGVRSNNIKSDCVNGVVTLTGLVDSLGDKRRAVRVATTIRGVRAVVDRLLTRPTDRDDSEIGEEVVMALSEDPATDSWEIVVDVDEGTVTLTGQVESYVEKVLCEQIAADVRGVQRVKNEVTVDRASIRPNHEIKAEIERRVKSDIWLIDPNIEVTVDNGQVTLSGTVVTEAEKQRLYNDAWVAGVSSVDMSAVRTRPERGTELLRHRPYVPGNDHEILQAVKAAITYDPRVSAERVQVHVESGTVTLAGVVESLRAKQAAEQDARNSVGVWDVKNALRVEIASHRSPEEIEDSVRASIARDTYLSGYEIAVAVERHTVVLEGVVRSEFDKRHAEQVASRILGVSEVDNRLSVESLREAASDLMLQYRIENQLYWSPLVDNQEIEVTVDDGGVLLTGTVDSPNAFEAAADIAMEAGAKQLINELEIRDVR